MNISLILLANQARLTYFVMFCFAGPVWHHCGQWDYGSFSSHHQSGGHEAETCKNGGGHQPQWSARHHRGFGALLSRLILSQIKMCKCFDCVMFVSQGVCGALTVLMRDAIKPNLMQTLEVRGVVLGCEYYIQVNHLELHRPWRLHRYIFSTTCSNPLSFAAVFCDFELCLKLLYEHLFRETLCLFMLDLLQTLRMETHQSWLIKLLWN